MQGRNGVLLLRWGSPISRFLLWIDLIELILTVFSNRSRCHIYFILKLIIGCDSSHWNRYRSLMRRWRLMSGFFLCSRERGPVIRVDLIIRRRHLQLWLRSLRYLSQLPPRKHWHSSCAASAHWIHRFGCATSRRGQLRVPVVLNSWNIQIERQLVIKLGWNILLQNRLVGPVWIVGRGARGVWGASHTLVWVEVLLARRVYHSGVYSAAIAKHALALLCLVNNWPKGTNFGFLDFQTILQHFAFLRYHFLVHLKAIMRLLRLHLEVLLHLLMYPGSYPRGLLVDLRNKFVLTDPLLLPPKI